MFQQIARTNWFLYFEVCVCLILAACSISRNEILPATRSSGPAPDNTVPTVPIEPTTTVSVVQDPTAPALPATPTTSGTGTPVAPTETVSYGFPASPSKISGIEIIPSRGDLEIPLIQQAGVVWIRVNAILWSDVEQAEGQRNWSVVKYLEDLMVSASEQGLQTIMVVRGTPFWAQKVSGSQCGPIRAEKFQAFASFMVELVDRYSVPPYNVKYWEIWNEPDVDPSIVKSDSIYGCWGDQTDIFYGGQYYGSMLKTIYPQIKAATQDIQIVVGGLLLDCDPVNPPEWPFNSGQTKDCSSSRFFEGILESGAGDSFDLISFHAYDYYGEDLGVYGNFNWNAAWNTTGPVAIKKARYLQGLLSRFGLQKEMLDTETALICASSQSKCSTEEYNLTKAYYAAISLGTSRMLGLGANIWYSTLGWRSSGLFGAEYRPLPVFESYRFSIQELDQARFRRVIDDYPGLSGFEFERDGTIIWLIWSQTDMSQTIWLPEAPDSVYDVFGSILAADRALTITVAPIYLEWEP